MAVEIHLPCCFALKSKRHESYLRYVHEEGDETTNGQLQLNGEDAVNPFTRFDSEPSLLHEGMVHIRCRYNRKYWVPRQRGGGWWIAADAHEPEEDIDSANCTLIKPIISVTDSKSKANDDDTTTGAAMTEPVLDREIYNVEYRLNNVRIYETSVITMATTAAVNDTSKENIKTLTLAYEESELSTWDATLELKLGYKSRLRAGFPKLGLGATVNISAEFFGAYNWAETMEKKVSHEVEYEVTVPPKTKVTVRLIATRSAIDVPFDYQQRDVMSTDGKARVVSRTDGLYTGVNSYNFKFQTTEEKLKPRLLATTPP
ncbi:natterin-1-like [Triticum aestivum]|uniref:natterin-1-like n=1 Tax=Triticum aestivum TaxID=4565 RepID=UPI001D025675|nr:natterin-1-like [Triticum aestivum]